MVVPPSTEIDTRIGLEPARDKRAVRPCGYYGVTEAPAIAAFVAQDDVVRAGHLTDGVKGAQGKGIDVEVDAALLVEKFEAHYIGQMGVLSVGLHRSMMDQLDGWVLRQSSDPCVGLRVGISVRRGWLGEVGVVDVDGIRLERYEGAAHGEVGEEVEMPRARVMVGILQAEDEMYDVRYRLGCRDVFLSLDVAV